jgi:hypothetical protein
MALRCLTVKKASSSRSEGELRRGVGTAFKDTWILCRETGEFAWDHIFGCGFGNPESATSGAVVI